MKTFAIVVGTIEYKGKILILHRTTARHYTPNLWEFVSGFLGEREAAEDAVLREVKEETGLVAKIKKPGEMFKIEDDGQNWIIIPFLVEVDSDKIKLDSKEHTEYRWIDPKDIKNFDTVKGVFEDLRAVGML